MGSRCSERQQLITMKRLLLFSAVLLLLAAGCSKIDKMPPGEEWVWNESLPVPISFESGGGLDVETRAAITNENLSSTDLGLFALSVDKDNNNFPNWSGGNESVLLQNEKVRTNAEGTIVVNNKYYPNDNQYNYSFYSYAPYSEEVKVGSDRIRVEFDLGEADIIYGESHATKYDDAGGLDSDSYGFKASYIRRVKREQEEGKLPNITYNHMLTALNFNAKLEGSQSSIAVKSIAILNTFTKATLFIADKNLSDGDQSGTIEGSSNDTLYVGGPDRDWNAWLHNDKYLDNPIGGGLFLIPDDSYEIQVTYKIMASADDVIREDVVKATINMSGGFLAGTRYNVNMKIYSPERMEIDTDVASWEEEDYPDDVQLIPTMFN